MYLCGSHVLQVPEQVGLDKAPQYPGRAEGHEESEYVDAADDAGDLLEDFLARRLESEVELQNGEGGGGAEAKMEVEGQRVVRQINQST